MTAHQPGYLGIERGREVWCSDDRARVAVVHCDYGPVS